MLPVGNVSLESLIESRESIEREIKQRAQAELVELDARRATLLALVGDETCAMADDVVWPTVTVPKYRDPASGKTWSGRGKRPKWFDVERADDFLIPHEIEPAEIMVAD